MGAYGSGRWHGQEKAVSVEDCFILDTSTFRDNWQLGQRHTSGRLIWGQSHSSASYTLARGTREAALRLTYFCDSRRNDDTILLVPTRPHFGGRRWWFICPACGGRARKLFLPPSRPNFRCRRCHRLTYRSCQESHTAFGELRRLQRMGLWPRIFQ